VEQPVVQEGDAQLRLIADTYEQAQRARIRAGEQIRAVVQGRDMPGEPEEADQPDEDTDESEPPPTKPKKALSPAQIMLNAIRDGETEGPVPVIGRAYRRMYEQERDCFAAMKALLPAHPTWPWLKRIKGVGPTLACKILARLDPRDRPGKPPSTPSSFWRYCGLDTVPGVEYRCAVCGVVRGFPVGTKVKGPHSPMGTGKGKCRGTLDLARGPEDGVRVRRPQSAHGEKRPYDAYAKKVMYLIGTSFLKCGGSYEGVYRREADRLAVERLGWPDGRRHLTALRKAEKLFLSHLWLVWRTALNLPTTAPYAQSELGHVAGYVDPWWDMVEDAP
jgi:hypothetical protein